MAGYTIAGASGGTSVKSVVALSAAASTPNRGAVSSVEFGATTVVSAALQWILQRSTAAGAGTSFTPTTDDPGDAASNFTGLVALTSDPTLTANAYELFWPFYQNNSGRWVAENDRQRKMIPAVASNGMALIVSIAQTLILAGAMHFEQQ
jgi:hypothetical protein